jgi:hypothetical protein
MNQHQAVHIGMINSYNVLINGAKIEHIILSGIGVFAHSEYEEDSKISIEFMIEYFKSLEMYEKCAGLQCYIDENFNDDGTFKNLLCSCEYPDIEKYDPIPKCSLCKLKIKRL